MALWLLILHMIFLSCTFLVTREMTMINLILPSHLNFKLVHTIFSPSPLGLFLKRMLYCVFLNVQILYLSKSSSPFLFTARLLDYSQSSAVSEIKDGCNGSPTSSVSNFACTGHPSLILLPASCSSSLDFSLQYCVCKIVMFINVPV